MFYLILIFVTAAIPFNFLIPWLANSYKEINAKLEKPESSISFSFAWIIQGLIWILDFSKGYFLLGLGNYLFDSDLANVIILIIILCSHNWSILLRFKSNKNLGLVLWGIYTFLYPPLAIIYPLSFLFLSLIFNSFIMGLVLSIIGILFILSFSSLASIYLVGNFFIFIIVFIANSNKLILHLEGNRQTILKSFLNRS